MTRKGWQHPKGEPDPESQAKWYDLIILYATVAGFLAFYWYWMTK